MGGKTSNHIKQSLRKLRSVRTWQLALILIPLSFVAATLLRLDHLRMAELRQAVLDADKADDPTLTSQRLTELQNFVFSHIVISVTESNGLQSLTFGTGPFYLENQYLRAAGAAIEAAETQISSDANPHGNIYAAVSAICKPLAIANGWAWNTPAYLDCWTSELAKYPTTDRLEANLTADLPSTELFRLSYASPLWAPTWAGLALLACAILLVAIIFRLFARLALKFALLFLKNS